MCRRICTGKALGGHEDTGSMPGSIGRQPVGLCATAACPRVDANTVDLAVEDGLDDRRRDFWDGKNDRETPTVRQELGGVELNDIADAATGGEAAGDGPGSNAALSRDNDDAAGPLRPCMRQHDWRQVAECSEQRPVLRVRRAVQVAYGAHAGSGKGERGAINRQCIGSNVHYVWFGRATAHRRDSPRE
jgi:hypothetical protein